MLLMALTRDAVAQSSVSDRVQQHRAKMQRMREEMRREMRNGEFSGPESLRKRFPPTNSRSSTLPTHTTRSTNAASQGERKDAEAHYILRSGEKQAYAVEIAAVEGSIEWRWKGAIVLVTETPTPLHDDGRPYNGGRAKVWGRLNAFRAVAGTQDWTRVAGEDFVLPETLYFKALGLGDHKLPESSRSRLPGSMSVRLGVLSAIFPEAPMFAVDETREEKRSYLEQTIYPQSGSGTIAYIKGLAKVQVKAAKGQYQLKESFDGRDADGTPALQYELQRSATFDVQAGQLERCVTTFASQVPNPIQVAVSTRRVSLQEAVEIAGGK